MCRRMSRGWVSFLTFLLVVVVGRAQQPAIAIRVVEGDRAINSIKLRRGHDPVVQVLDATGEPVTGAAVTFLLPASGPSGTFADGGLSLTAQTDRRGMAAARGLKPNRVEGQFRIRATTSFHGEAASATILQTNAEPFAKSGNSKWVVIALVIGGAAAGGAVAATHGGKSAAAASPVGSVGSTGSSTIVPGSPSFGPPR
jgi:hypothetical protein